MKEPLAHAVELFEDRMENAEIKVCNFPSLTDEEIEILKTLTHNPPGSGGRLDSLMLLWLQGGRNNPQHIASVVRIDGEIVAWSAGVPHGTLLYQIGSFTRADKRKRGFGRIAADNLLKCLSEWQESERPISIWYGQGIERLFGPLVVKHGFKNFQKYSSECAEEIRKKIQQLTG